MLALFMTSLTQRARHVFATFQTSVFEQTGGEIRHTQKLLPVYFRSIPTDRACDASSARFPFNFGSGNLTLISPEEEAHY